MIKLAFQNNGEMNILQRVLEKINLHSCLIICKINSILVKVYNVKTETIKVVGENRAEYKNICIREEFQSITPKTKTITRLTD